VRRKLRRRSPDKAAREFRRALGREGCPDCGSRKTVLRAARAGEVAEVSLLHTEACARRLDPFGGDSLGTAAAKAVRLRYMASDGGGGGVVQDVAP
jgi:hypothetical protein